MNAIAERLVARVGFTLKPTEMEFASLPDPENPKSSTMTAWSVLALLDELPSPIRYF